MRAGSQAVRRRFCVAQIINLRLRGIGLARFRWLPVFLCCSGCFQAYIPGNQLPPAQISIQSPSDRPTLALVVNVSTYHSGIEIPFDDVVSRVTESSGFADDFSIKSRRTKRGIILDTAEISADFEITMVLHFGEERDNLWSLPLCFASLFIFPFVTTTPVYLDAVVRNSGGRIVGSYALEDSYRSLTGFSILPSFLWLRRGIDVGEGIIKNLLLSLYQEIECHGVLLTDRSRSQAIPGCPETSPVEASDNRGAIKSSGMVPFEVGDTVYTRANQVGLWSEPSTSSEKILLERGHRVKIIDKQGNWCHVEDDADTEGWVSCVFLASEKPH